MRSRSHRARQLLAEDGLTLIELLLVFGIIAIMLAIAMPNYQKFVSKSKRAEAYSVLRGMSVTQAGFYAEHDMYASGFDSMGFEMARGTTDGSQAIIGPNYTYTLTPTGPSGWEWTNFRVTAVGDIDPSDTVTDIIIIENRVTVVEP